MGIGGLDLAAEWVTPCAGVWIEISLRLNPICRKPVTPCAGVWIEIQSP